VVKVKHVHRHEVDPARPLAHTLLTGALDMVCGGTILAKELSAMHDF
jgi:hypothetical protein